MRDQSLAMYEREGVWGSSGLPTNSLTRNVEK